MGFCQVHTRIVLWVMLAFLKESGGAHIYKFGLAAGGAIAEMHPFADCYGFFISYVINGHEKTVASFFHPGADKIFCPP